MKEENVEKIRRLIAMMKTMFETIPDSKDVQEVMITYELVKEGCRKSENFTRGVELYVMEHALAIHDKNQKEGKKSKSMEQLLKELTGKL